jgi:N-acetylneuraminate synthase
VRKNNSNKTLVIAEAGVNHNGDIKKAKQLIEIAASAGADFVKFQTFKAENLVTKNASKADYQIANDPSSNDQFSMLKQLELSQEDHHELIQHANEHGIKFLSTGFDLESLDFLHSLNMQLFKIPSGEITNLPYLKKIASFKKPVIISTGMANIQEIQDAVAVLTDGGVSKNQITILHCNTDYPTHPSDVNLKAMLTIQNQFNTEVGYSDHTEGIEVSLAAVALGASVIEKHFTIDKSLPGPDHKASLNPEELHQLIHGIRVIEEAISGTGQKIPSESELKNKNIARKGLYFNKNLPQGHTICESDFTVLRPFSGISPMELPHIIGKTLKQDVQEGDAIKLSDF